MYDQYGSPFAYASNPASGFLDTSVQQSMSGAVNGQGGALQQQFNNVMSSMAGGINTGASQGQLPWQGANPAQYPRFAGESNIQYKQRLEQVNKLTPAQAAQMMSIAGPTSVLPYVGGPQISRVIFPLAGAWSLYDGIRSMRAMHNELQTETSTHARFNPEQLSYDRTLKEMEASRSDWAHLQY